MKSIKQLVVVALCLLGISITASAQQQEVTNGLVRQYSIDLTNVTAPGGVETIHWEIVRQDGNPLEATILSAFPDAGDKNQTIDVTWNGTVGDVYILRAKLEDKNNCISEAVSQEVIILPADGNFMFADATAGPTVCSFNGAGEKVSFDVTYQGIKPWKLHYSVTDKNGVKKDFIAKNAAGDEIEFTTANATFEVDIDDFFINPDAGDADWTVELVKAVSVADSHETLAKGATVSKVIKVHQLPVINGGITLN